MAEPRATKLSPSLIRSIKRAEQLATRHKVDLQELKWATKYLGRNIGQLSTDVRDGLTAIVLQQERVSAQLDNISAGLGRLTLVTAVGFRLTLEYLNLIADQLHHIIEILKYPTRTQASELRERGIFLAGKGKPFQAVEHLQKAIMLNQTDFVSLCALGIVYASNDQYRAAADALNDCALYADPSPALSAEAAILAAHCYAQLDEPSNAWKVLHRTLATNCPDLALPLVKYAQTEADFKFALDRLAEAFVVDAELVLVAEDLELNGVKEAAKAAHTKLVGHNTRLEQLWHQVASTNAVAGIDQGRKLPRSPEAIGTAQSQLMNAAIYRRRLQMSVSGAVDVMRERINAHPEVPSLPFRPTLDHDGGPLRLAGSVGLLLVAIWLWPNNVGLAETVAIFSIGLSLIDIVDWYNYVRGWMDYLPRRTRTARNAAVVKARIEQFDAARDAVYTGMVEAERALAETLPPAVPRAFAGELVDYTKFSN